MTERAGPDRKLERVAEAWEVLLEDPEHAAAPTEAVEAADSSEEHDGLLFELDQGSTDEPVDQ